MRRRGGWMAWVVAGLGLAGLGAECGREDTARPKGEDLTITVEADRSKLSAEEQKLRAQLETFEAERQKLREERAQLMGSKDELKDKDEAAARRLRELEQRLWERERAMWSREAELEKERANLGRAKDEILDKLPAGAKAAGEPQGSAALVGREGRVADREADLAAREKRVAAREAAVAEREAECGRLLAKLGDAPRPVAYVRPSPSEGAVSKAEAERQVAAAEKAMKAKGLRWDDLPAEMGGIRTDQAAARKAKDWARLKELAGQLEATVAATVVDSGFIDRKFARLNQAMTARPPEDKKAKTASLRKVTQLVGDGQYQAANQELNKLFHMLPK